MICGASVQFALDSVQIALTPENINNDICDNELFENYGDCVDNTDTRKQSELFVMS